MASRIDPRRVNSDDLRFLLVVARTGRRAAAAADLGVNDSTVTRRIRSLERTLGVRLIQMGNTGWELTAAGHTVATAAAPIEAAVERAANSVFGEDIESLRGTVRVGAPDAFGACFVAPALARMRREHPHLSIELMTATRQTNLHQSDYDLTVTVGEPSNTRLVSEQLTTYALGLYATRRYLEDFGCPTSIPEISDHTLIWFVDSLLQVGELDLDRHIPGATAQFTSTNVFAHVEATRVGAGIGLLPTFLARRHDDLVPVLANEVDVRIGYCLATRRDRLSSPAVQEIRAAIHRELAARGSELIPVATA